VKSPVAGGVREAFAKSPTERIHDGLTQAHQGIVDLREEFESGARAQAIRQSDLVGSEDRLRSLALQARRARFPRHLRPHETAGPRRPMMDSRPPASEADPDVFATTLDDLAAAPVVQAAEQAPPSSHGRRSRGGPVRSDDRFTSGERLAPGEQEVGRFDPRETIVAVTTVDEVTRASLSAMGLAPAGSSARASRPRRGEAVEAPFLVRVWRWVRGPLAEPQQACVHCGGLVPAWPEQARCPAQAGDGACAHPTPDQALRCVLRTAHDGACGPGCRHLAAAFGGAMAVAPAAPRV